ncbi:hypothetical protein [Pseudanabaena yagii]|uniref:DUF4325 domain-containing protein n=1 Tax=Pseudanabaena yagii GIHE-NHR1 TaxID=2722753 RepID=A0ABX1LU85_9CYAN|nr:hypothetical protein [Pseudanabaena yagii]NMF57462.1 hypothetical protein [Pseudanabaena yagii GIHE-NHR1]
MVKQLEYKDIKNNQYINLAWGWIFNSDGSRVLRLRIDSNPQSSEEVFLSVIQDVVSSLLIQNRSKIIVDGLTALSNFVTTLNDKYNYPLFLEEVMEIGKKEIETVMGSAPVEFK